MRDILWWNEISIYISTFHFIRGSFHFNREVDSDMDLFIYPQHNITTHSQLTTFVRHHTQHPLWLHWLCTRFFHASRLLIEVFESDLSRSFFSWGVAQPVYIGWHIVWIVQVLFVAFYCKTQWELQETFLTKFWVWPSPTPSPKTVPPLWSGSTTPTDHAALFVEWLPAWSHTSLTASLGPISKGFLRNHSGFPWHTQGFLRLLPPKRHKQPHWKPGFPRITSPRF